MWALVKGNVVRGSQGVRVNLVPEKMPQDFWKLGLVYSLSKVIYVVWVATCYMKDKQYNTMKYNRTHQEFLPVQLKKAPLAPMKDQGHGPHPRHCDLQSNHQVAEVARLAGP
ncbi:hypothetical protein EDB89DRAFT_1907907 [Lactarius sanguifluus]|nr:hypothetical protein EDB89DRAFT_1907907 [Lactarius sanguifluus]